MSVKRVSVRSFNCLLRLCLGSKATSRSLMFCHSAGTINRSGNLIVASPRSVTLKSSALLTSWGRASPELKLLFDGCEKVGKPRSGLISPSCIVASPSPSEVLSPSVVESPPSSVSVVSPPSPSPSYSGSGRTGYISSTWTTELI